MPTLQDELPVVYYRGGTSKALFFHEKDLPERGSLRDRLLKRVMGSPDPMQIDGMGGSHIVTSKIAIIRPSLQPNADIDYTFAQVSIKDDDISYSGNCGNISAAVGPFAVDEGLVKTLKEGATIDPKIKTAQLRIYNTGTQKILISHVPINASTGKSIEAGSFSIAGVPGTGAPILIDFKETISTASGNRTLPLGSRLDHINVGDRQIPFTLCNAGNNFIFARAADLGLVGHESPENLDCDTELISRIKELRGKVAEMACMCQNWVNVDQESPMSPMVMLMSESTNAEANIQARLFLDNKCHTSMAGTGAIAIAACSRIQESIVHGLLRPGSAKQNMITIQHPQGLMPVFVEVKSGSQSSDEVPEFTSLSMVRTSRRILDGRLRIPQDFVSVCT